jgi:serine protease Do
MKRKFFVVLLMVLFSSLNLFALSTDNLPNFVDIVKKVKPAVVNINTTKIIKKKFSNPFFHFQSPFGKNDPFNDFFQKFFGNTQPYKKFKQKSLGSGFIISKDGYILTNNHVVSNADEINVTLSNNHSYKAKIIGTDPKTDIALIKINPKQGEELTVVKLGDSDSLQVGEWVLAIGNPFGFSRTVTAGIVSAKGRVIGEGPYDSFIQTDAAINPGNSGGPLINLKGEVVGINTAIIAAAQGIGFAIPINMAKFVVKQIKTKGYVQRGWLGVYIQPVNKDLADYFNMKEPYGALVADVVKDGPADKAGIKRGDIIVSFDGKKVESTEVLPKIVASTPIGKEVNIGILREGKKMNIKAKIGEMPESKSEAVVKKSETFDNLGLRVSNITPEIMKQYGIHDSEGVLILEVKNGSPADNAGIREGDIIKSVEYHIVKNIDDYYSIVRNFKKDKMLVDVKRGNSRIFFVLKLK